MKNPKPPAISELGVEVETSWDVLRIVKLRNQPPYAVHHPEPSRLEKYINAVPAASERWRPSAASRRSRRVEALVRALRAVKDDDDAAPLNKLLALTGTPNAIEWELAQVRFREPAKLRPRGRPRSSLVETLHLAHLDYLDRRDRLQSSLPSVTDADERARLEDALKADAEVKSGLLYHVAMEWHSAQLLFTSGDKGHKAGQPVDRLIPKDRLIKPETLELAIDRRHASYNRWLKQRRLPFPA